MTHLRKRKPLGLEPMWKVICYPLLIAAALIALVGSATWHCFKWQQGRETRRCDGFLPCPRKISLASKSSEHCL